MQSEVTPHPIPFTEDPGGTEIHEAKKKTVVISKENEWRMFKIGTPIKVNGRIFVLRKVTDKDLVFRPEPLGVK